MKQTLALSGNYCIDIVEHDKIKRLIIKNQLTDINQAIRAAMLMGNTTYAMDDIAIKYIALGTSGALASASDTQLGAETYRKQVTQQTLISPSTVQTIVSFGSGEANFTIREIGVFAGPSATAEANTGTLLSRVVVEIAKNTNMTLNIMRQDICTI